MTFSRHAEEAARAELRSSTQSRRATQRLQRASGEAVERVLLFAFIGALAWCPFWFGSNDFLAWGINAILFPGLAAAYEISILLRRGQHPVALARSSIPALLFGAAVVWIVIQNSTMTPPTVHQPIWQMAAEALDRPLSGSISIDRNLTTVALVRLITAASAFWLALQLCRNAQRAYLLLRAFAIIGALYALYGLFAFALTPGYVLWLPTMFSKGHVTSTFINHNSFATYAGMALLVVCGLTLRLYRHEALGSGGPARFRVASFIEVTGGQGALMVALGFVLSVALLLSGSRGGIFATGFGLFVLVMLSMQRRRGEGKERIEIIGFVALLVAAVFLAFGDQFLGRIAEHGLTDQGRMAAYTITLNSIWDAPLTGFGYGTFPDVFPIYRDRAISVFGTWGMAHDTYLEVLQGLGVLFGAALIGSVGMFVYACVKGATTRQSSATVPCVAAGCAFLVGLHSLVDFSLQIQAVALTFAALLGAGVAQSESSRLAVGD